MTRKKNQLSGSRPLKRTPRPRQKRTSCRLACVTDRPPHQHLQTRRRAGRPVRRARRARRRLPRLPADALRRSPPRIAPRRWERRSARNGAAVGGGRRAGGRGMRDHLDLAARRAKNILGVLLREAVEAELLTPAPRRRRPPASASPTLDAAVAAPTSCSRRRSTTSAKTGPSGGWGRRRRRRRCSRPTRSRTAPPRSRARCATRSTARRSAPTCAASASSTPSSSCSPSR